ncbi:MAG: septum formation initiator family protein [Deltaproteobacteria bacterium]|nr:septum formation initiator family protein [Deltaproteobacteria bacterium]
MLYKFLDSYGMLATVRSTSSAGGTGSRVLSMVTALAQALKWVRFIVVLLLLVSAGMLMGEKGLAQRKELLKKKADLEKANTKLGSEIVDLERRVTLVRTDGRVVERAAKRKLGMARPEETVYIFTRRDSVDADHLE